MTNDEYLQRLLSAHSLDPDGTEIADLKSKRGEVEKVLRAAYGSAPRILYGGSFAKGTMIIDSYDLDISLTFDNDDTTAGETLEEIYNSVRETLSDDYTVQEKRSALRLESTSETHEYTHVDVVPGRFVDDEKDDQFLHQTEGDKERLKTNIKVQIAHIRDSGRADLIKLAKLWRIRAQFELKTFVLELLVIEVLKGKADALDALFTTFLTELRDNLDDYNIEDPANPTGNDLSPIFGPAEKEALRSAAMQALELLDSGDYSDVFGESFPEDDEESVEQSAELWPSLRLGDTSHRQAPPWPWRKTSWNASIVCEVTAPNQQRMGYVQSNAMPLRIGSTLHYRVTTDVPPPYDVHWQVVNTGADATVHNGLRGDFFRGKKVFGGVTSDQHENFESTAYVGGHSIQAFVVKAGTLVAWSDPFYVRLIAKQRFSRFRH